MTNTETTTKTVSQLKREKFTLHYSNRDLPLVYMGAPIDVPIVTVENYCKWYSVFIIMPDGTIIKSQDMPEWNATMDAFGGVPYVDHVFNPKFINKFTANIKGTLDDQAFEMMVGRWQTERCGEWY